MNGPSLAIMDKVRSHLLNIYQITTILHFITLSQLPMTRATLSPTNSELAAKATQRIEVLDVLRGFALFGIILVHSCQMFPKSAQLSGFDQNLKSLLGHLFDGRAASIFGFLFGLGFAIQMQSAQKRSQPFIGKFLWRITILLFIGYLHGLIYTGDILQEYAILALVLIACSGLKNKQLLLFASLLYIAGIVSRFYFEDLMAAIKPIEMASKENFLLKLFAVNKLDTLMKSGRLFTIPILFIFGYVVGRKNVFQNEQALRYRRIFIYSAICFSASIVLFYLAVRLGIADIYQNIAFGLKHFIQAFLYVAIILFVYRIAQIKGILDYLSPLGRMGLTIYIMQTLLLQFYYGQHLGLSLTVSIIITVALFGCQILIATIWMQYFKFGPLEWLWRSMTDLKLHPIRKAAN